MSMKINFSGASKNICEFATSIMSNENLKLWITAFIIINNLKVQPFCCMHPLCTYVVFYWANIFCCHLIWIGCWSKPCLNSWCIDTWFFFSFCSASHFISPSVVKCTIGGKTSHHSHHVNWVPTYVVVHNSILEGGDSFNVAHCYIWKFLKVFFVKMLNKIGIYIFS